MEARAFQFDQHKMVSEGKEIYEKIREKLEPEHRGEIVAIETESGEYFLGKTVVEAGEKAKQKHPHKIFYFVKVGFPAVHIRR